jgi:hypothetical protein
MEKYNPAKEDEYALCSRFWHEYQTLSLMNQFRKDLYVFHVENERKCSVQQHIRRARIGVVAGVADYIVFIEDGRFAAIEFKRNAQAIKKFNQGQEDFKAMCNDFGAPYLKTCSVEEAIDFLKSL